MLGKKPAAPLKPFQPPRDVQALHLTVYVADNFHYMLDEETYKQGSYATLAEAVIVCAEVVNRWLKEVGNPGMSSEQLYQQYITFGEDPFIVGPDTSAERFSAWGYAKHRSAEICPPYTKEKRPIAPNQ